MNRDLPPAAEPAPQSIAIAVVEHQGSYLIGQRPPGAVLAGLWEFPGGKVQPGESAAQAAIRECLEETGLTVVVRGTLAPEVHRYAHGAVELNFFDCAPVDPAQPPSAPFRWVRLAELANYEFPAGNRRLLDFLMRSLDSSPARGR